tara:strand:- start:428001 stop:428534 length:534 start_codon:yes stop_codon:yes gene_type:complete
MKNLKKLSTVLIALLFFLSCTADADQQNNTTVDGEIQLSGEDTTSVGTTLKVGAIAYGRKDLTGIEASIVIAPFGSTISEGSPTLAPTDPAYVRSIINFKDDKNAFVIVVTQELISMVIVTNGVERRYVCDSKFNTSVTCGSITLDAQNKTLIFNNSTVKNTDTDTILTLNGTLNWN